jgi:hypothetical protein
MASSTGILDRKYVKYKRNLTGVLLLFSEYKKAIKNNNRRRVRFTSRWWVFNGLASVQGTSNHE